ncbi:hypothetical protein BKA70DRAFT_602682 [Coprinopsis sp. MPI-PUGE-AT-0042]|nr:hypothetical protein BKA70DRAFT_602682 [Coprinopsis sp. MPI-PUGE-AT-0042]
MRANHSLLCILVATAAVAQTPTGNTDFLRGENEIWSCKLQEQLNEGCPSSDDEVTRRALLPREPEDVPDHSPSTCTCNNIYFNIWSACALTNENTHTLPSLREWSDTCRKAGLDYKNNLEPSGNRLEGVWIPPWARLPVLGDTFDVMKAVVVASPPDWRLVHILAPILSCVATLLMVGIVYFTVTRNRRKGPWFGKFSFPRPSLRPVRYEAPKDDWVIDQQEDTFDRRQEGRTDVGASRSSLSLDADYRQNNHSAKGPYLGQASNSKNASKKNVLKKLKHSASNPDLEKNASTSTIASAVRPPAIDLTLANNPALASPPLASKWSDTDSLRTAPQQAKRLPGTATFNALVNQVRIPFGRPHRLQHVAPDPRFQLDDYNASPPASRKPTYDQTIAGILANTGRSGLEAARRPDARAANEERQSLITDEDRTSNHVFLISKQPGEDFSVGSDQGQRSEAMSSRQVHSDIQIQSPTETTRESWRPNGQPQEQREKPAPVPPMPRYPPPVPPSRSHSNTAYPLANVPDDVDKLPKSSGASSTREASESQSPPSVGLIPAPFRGYAYTPDRYPTPDASPSGSTRYRPLPSPESYFEVLPQSERKKQKNRAAPHEGGDEVHVQPVREETLRQRPLPLDPPPPAPVRHNSPYISSGNHYSARRLPVPPTSPPMHDRTLSSASSTSSSLGEGVRHWRGPSDEDASSFYLSPSSPPMHLRTLSQENAYRR